MRSLRTWDVPVDLNRRFDDANPLATLIPNFDDNASGVALGEPAYSNLSRAGRRLHGRVQAVELGAFVIVHALCTIMNIELVAGHGCLLLAGNSASDIG